MPALRRPERRRVEADISDEIRARLAKIPEVTLWRNNVGALQDKNGTWLRYGLAPGSADLIGVLTAYYRGHPTETVRVGRFLAIEVKKPGEKPTEDQRGWLEVVRKAGGLVGVCTSADEAEELIARGMRWEI
jgi:hypothetical protein